MKREFAASFGAAVIATTAYATEAVAPPLSPLPEGPLLLVAGNVHAANFIDLERTSQDGDVVEVWYLSVRAAPVQLGEGPDRKVVQSVESGVLDCAARTYALRSSEGFNEAGERIIWLPSANPEPIERSSTFDFFARVLCDGVELPATNTFIGHEAARQAAYRMLGVNHSSRRAGRLAAQP